MSNLGPFDKVDTITRCGFSDLPAYCCGCNHCRPDVVTEVINGDVTVIPGEGAQFDEVAVRVTKRFETAIARRCDGCDVKIHVGETVARTADGDYVCVGCSV